MIFLDRTDAGRRLAARLDHLRGEDVVVLGLPRGGVPVAFEVAERLGAPLDVIVVRKLGVPFQPELAMGAVGEDGVLVSNDDVVRLARVGAEEFARIEARERTEVERRAKLFRGNRPRIDIAGRVALIVDDGIATGSTALAACRVARAHGASRVLLAVPVAAADSAALFHDVADELVCLETPTVFYAVGEWYEDFSATGDEEVSQLLSVAAGRFAAPSEVADRAATAAPGARDADVEVLAGGVRLAGRLTVPAGAAGAVVFAHGSGSSHHSPRNRAVAAALNRAGLATLLFDLLTPAEETDRTKVFDVELLAERLSEATQWLRGEPGLRDTPVGYFGASTGAAAALAAASAPQAQISAVVSRGGRPDLAGARLAGVRAATLLIVGGLDDVVLGLNRQAQSQLRCENKLVVVPGATHLFDEPGTLDKVAALACDWFIAHLVPPAPTRVHT